MPDTPLPPSSPALAAFGVLTGPRAGAEIPVPSPVVTIGQGSQNDLVLADDSVSKQHARLEFEHGGWRLTDLDSTNGTSVEGVRLAPNVPTPLAYGNTVRFGGMQLQFRAVEAADPEAARAGYTSPAPPTPVAQRKPRLRLPLWLFLAILILIAVVLFLVLGGPAGEPAAVETGAASLLLLLRPDIPPNSP